MDNRNVMDVVNTLRAEFRRMLKEELSTLDNETEKRVFRELYLKLKGPLTECIMYGSTPLVCKLLDHMKRELELADKHEAMLDLDSLQSYGQKEPSLDDIMGRINLHDDDLKLN